MVRGTLQFDPDKLPFGAGSLLFSKVQPIPAHFEGAVPGLDGFVASSGFDLTIQPGCVMVSCPVFEPWAEVIGFVRRGPEGLLLAADPCITPVFAATEATAALLWRLTQ